jgi:divalent metal cation (Fe/Co/Zn/Cd) transporter
VKVREQFEMPADRRELLSRARRLEWVTLALMLTVIVAIYLTMGSSQAMKVVWIENMLSLVPPLSFLVADRFARRAPTPEFPYGYHRAVSIAFLSGAMALTIFGGFVLTDSLLTLFGGERPAIGLRSVFGRDLWAGWLMIAALAYDGVVPFILGRLKLPLSRELHDKTLKADADMNRADWLTSGAGIAGILGIGLGLWWADAGAAAVISFSILKDGLRNLSRVVRDLMDRRPTSVEGDFLDLPARVRDALQALGWVDRARVRLREEGHVLAGEVFLAAAGDAAGVDQVEEARRVARGVDWRIREVVVSLERHGKHAPGGAGREGGDEEEGSEATA